MQLELKNGWELCDDYTPRIGLEQLFSGVVNPYMVGGTCAHISYCKNAKGPRCDGVFSPDELAILKKRSK